MYFPEKINWTYINDLRMQGVLTLNDGVGDGGVLALVPVDGAHSDDLGAHRLLFPDADDVLFRLHDQGRVVVDVGHLHLDRHSGTPRRASQVPGLGDQIEHSLGFPVQRLPRENFTWKREK